jgi:hypothetical protein
LFLVISKNNVKYTGLTLTLTDRVLVPGISPPAGQRGSGYLSRRLRLVFSGGFSMMRISLWLERKCDPAKQ